MKTHYSTTTKGFKGRIKRRYSDFIVEEIKKNGEKCKIERFDNQNNENKKPAQVPENSEKLEQLHFDLEKINTDLTLALKIISRFLGCSQKRIGYAGLKDKRAITCQRISIWKPNIERLEKLNLRGIELRNGSWGKKRIELGDLKGNSFTITIRDIDLNEKELKKRINKCFKEMKKGIPNYFGEQRFGGMRQITHLVGKQLVLGNIKKAVMLYLTYPNEKEENEIKKARKNLKKTKNFKQALKDMPVKQKYERAMLQHLSIHPKDFTGAFAKIPKKMRFLFTHAYQSYIFNEIINKRFETGIGLGLQKGEPEEKGIPVGLLPGYESSFSKGKIGKLEKEILKKEKVSFKDFKLKKLAECSSKGHRKEIVLFPKKLKIVKIDEDEFFEKKLKCVISFELDKGAYATAVVKEILKQKEINT